MNILLIFLLFVAFILLVLVIIDVPGVSQKWINILFLIMIIFFLIGNSGWVSGLSFHK